MELERAQDLEQELGQEKVCEKLKQLVGAFLTNQRRSSGAEFCAVQEILTGYRTCLLETYYMYIEELR